MEKCPICGNEDLFVHTESFGQRVVQVEPAYCKECKWTEDLNPRIYTLERCLKHHEEEYVDSKADKALVNFQRRYTHE
jgi:hypothetical protein